MEQAQNISANAAQTAGYYGMTIFHQLVCHNYYEAVEILLKKGVDPNVRGAEGKGDYKEAYKKVTPLHIACYEGNIKMVKLLIEYGADTTLCDEKERNCFHFLSSSYYDNMYNFCDPNDKEAAKQRLEIAKLLKCDINKRDVNGIAPLQCLVQNKTTVYSLFLTKLYLEYGADITVTDKDKNTVLMLAVEKGHITASKLLIEYPELINQKNNVGDTALHKVFQAKRYNVAAGYLLVQAGADIYAENNAGETVAKFIQEKESNYYWKLVEKTFFKRTLNFEDYFEIIERFACDWWGGKYDDYESFVYHIVRTILQEIDKDDDTELVNAIKVLKLLLSRQNECEAVQLFSEEKYDFCMPICEGSTVTTIRDICIEESWHNSQILAKLEGLGIDLNEALVGGCTPANIIAAKARRFDNHDIHKEMAKTYNFFSRESMEKLNYQGMAAVHLAAQNNCFELMEKMLEKGVDIHLTTDMPSETGNTPLHLACIYQNPKIAKLLIEAGADDSLINTKEETPAHCLFDTYKDFDRKKCYEIMEVLNNIDKPKAKTGETPLILLQKKSNSNQKELTELLLRKGADINRADNQGNTPLLLQADYHCDREVIKIMLKAGADINARDKAGNSPLHHVLRHGNCELARLLIKKGADYNVVNEKGKSPVDIAVENGYEVVLELMTDIKVCTTAEETLNL